MHSSNYGPGGLRNIFYTSELYENEKFLAHEWICNDFHVATAQ